MVLKKTLTSQPWFQDHSLVVILEESSSRSWVLKDGVGEPITEDLEHANLGCER